MLMKIMTFDRGCRLVFILKPYVPKKKKKSDKTVSRNLRSFPWEKYDWLTRKKYVHIWTSMEYNLMPPELFLRQQTPPLYVYPYVVFRL